MKKIIGLLCVLCGNVSVDSGTILHIDEIEVLSSFEDMKVMLDKRSKLINQISALKQALKKFMDAAHKKLSEMQKEAQDVSTQEIGKSSLAIEKMNAFRAKVQAEIEKRAKSIMPLEEELKKVEEAREAWIQKNQENYKNAIKEVIEGKDIDEVKGMPSGNIVYLNPKNDVTEKIKIILKKKICENNQRKRKSVE